MSKKFLRAMLALIAGGASYIFGVAFWYLSYKWDEFILFVKDFNMEVAVTLIVPGVLAGILISTLWPGGKKKS